MNISQQFIEALQRVEAEQYTDAMVELFADDCELWSMAHSQPLQGKEGAARFWREYAHAFKAVHSSFSRCVSQDGLAVLDWTSEVDTHHGRTVTYNGVSILEFEGDKICSFRSYYDSATIKSAGRSDQLAA